MTVTNNAIVTYVVRIKYNTIAILLDDHTWSSIKVTPYKRAKHGTPLAKAISNVDYHFRKSCIGLDKNDVIDRWKTVETLYPNYFEGNKNENQ